MTIQILEGDCRSVLKTMGEGSVQCTVTSPPYFGLRDYGTARWEGGDPLCDHDRVDTTRTAQANSIKGPNGGGKNGLTYAMMTKDVGGRCAKCGAVVEDKQIGLEQSPEEFVEALVEVFREVRRVTRDDGLLFLNIGDSYARDAGKGQHKPGDAGKQNYIIEKGGGRTASTVNLKFETQGSSDGKVGRHARAANALGGSGLKPKDLIGIPWMLAFALRADGWYLRQDIIWHKPNAMPESVEDRCTKSHEHIFLFSKRERYWFDADAIAETSTSAAMRNKRDVWSIPTEPSSIPHFAMMPTEIARLCILAGCPEGGTVLDPFGGVGTTAIVADRLKRNAVMIELNPESVGHMRHRLHDDAGMFAEVQ